MTTSTSYRPPAAKADPVDPIVAALRAALGTQGIPEDRVIELIQQHAARVALETIAAAVQDALHRLDDERMR